MLKICRHLFVSLSLCAAGASLAADATISGAGSSAAAPVYKVWAEQYARTGGASLNYDPSGSSAGIRKIRERGVDFGATDVAPSAAELARDDLVIFPTVISGVVPVYNLPKIRGGQLVLDAETLAALFSGEIRRWNDARLQRLNPGLSLPALAVTPVVRADGSGTTYNFSDYLAKVSPVWKQRLGVGTSLKWPQEFVQAKGSKGVVESVQANVGSIGYVDYNYVVDNQLSGARMRLADGSQVEATPNSFKNALMQSAWWTNNDFTQTLTAVNAKGAWPIAMGTFVLLPRTAADAERARATIRFFVWSFVHGDELAGRVNFVRLPDLVQGKAFRALAAIRDRNGVPLGVGELSTPAAVGTERR